MNESNAKDRSAQSDPSRAPEWVPTAEQPWRPVPDDDSGDSFQYDYGADWSVDRASHPQFNGGYPSPNHHRTECRSYDGFFGALDDAGRPGYFSAYLMRPFRFGQPGHAPDQTRLAIEFEPAGEGSGEPFRCTVHPDSIRNLAAYLAHTADIEGGWRPPRHLSQGLADS
ncbi:MAG TPA: hypothetical protein VLL08_06675 [Kineosporiaceae bacterium]|nr:hypothetical protein [Kineosporiaceae bacterium]